MNNLFLIDAPALRLGEETRECVRFAAHLNGLPVRRLVHLIHGQLLADASKAAQFESVGITAGALNYFRNYGNGSGQRTRRVCLSCVHHRLPNLSAWQSVPFSYCHIHRVKLTEKCPACRKPLLWTTDLADVCDRCSTHLSSNVPEPAPESAATMDFAEVIHRAALLNLNPTPCLAGLVDAEILMAKHGPLDGSGADKRLQWTYSLAKAGRRKLNTIEPGFSIETSWRNAIGPSMDSLVRRAAVSAVRIERYLSRPRLDFQFPTGWSFLDKRVARSMNTFRTMSVNSLKSFEDAQH